MDTFKAVALLERKQMSHAGIGRNMVRDALPWMLGDAVESGTMSDHDACSAYAMLLEHVVAEEAHTKDVEWHGSQRLHPELARAFRRTQSDMVPA